jgi:hypothetical protein
MGRPLKAAVAAALLALGIALLLPALAAAADAAPWVGTYKGVAVGKDANGKKGRTGVTIWVEDAGGDSTRFTFRFDKFPVVISRTSPNDGGTKGSMLMGISVDEPGVSGAGLIVVYPKNGNYMMAGKGAGKAVGKQGTGRMGAVRTCTGVQLPSMTEQVKDLFTALISRKVKSSSSASGGGSSGLTPAMPLRILSDDAAAESGDAASGEAATTQYDPEGVLKEAPDVVFVKAVTVEPASVIDVAAAKPPATTQTAFTAVIALIALTAIAAIVSIGPKSRGPVTATAPVEQPGSDGEGS